MICVSVSNITCNMQKINANIATKFGFFQDIFVQTCDLKCLIILVHSLNFIKLREVAGYIQNILQKTFDSYELWLPFL